MEKDMQIARIDNAAGVLSEYINHYKRKIATKKTGKGIRFFNNADQLLKELELIIGETLAGNTSVKMRNTGVAIIDTLLKMSVINRPQHSALYKKYFKI